MVAAICIVGALAVLALIGVGYVLFVALPKMADGMQQTGNGLQILGARFQDFANSMAQKLG
ncbi:MAG: hypothetical protein AB7T17_06655 [Geobacter sp.]|jgi:hypothetical protein